MDESTASIAAGDDIRPYKIHVSLAGLGRIARMYAAC